MFTKGIITILLTTMFIFSGCSSSSEDTTAQTSSSVLAGNAQKGPFLKGSSVTIYKIGEDFERTSIKVEGDIVDDFGTYDLNVSWSGLSEVVVSGYYYDETLEGTSTSSITLSSYTLAVANQRVETNVNVLTDLASQRIKTLLKNGNTFAQAQEQIMADFEDAFGIDFAEALYASGLDITDLNGANASVNAELLRLSTALLHSDDPIGDLGELIEAYNVGGRSGLKGSEFFKKLQMHRRDVNITEVIHNLEDHNFTQHVNVIPVLVTIPDQNTSDDTTTNKIQLTDINISLTSKTSIQFTTELFDDNITFSIAPQHGSIDVYFIGNEFIDFKYTSNDCFTGTDSFQYESGNYYGNVNITIVAPQTTQAVNGSNTLYNTQTIESQYLMEDSSNYTYSITTQPEHGSATLFSIGNEMIHYSYDPDDTHVGDDLFTYTLTQTINECTYSSLGTIHLTINEYIQPTQLVRMCKDPYSIGVELYKTDGSETGTTLVKQLYNGITSSGLAANTLIYIPYNTKIGNTQYFTAVDSHYKELWASDGTLEGTEIHEINPNPYSSTTLYGSSNPGYFNTAGNYLFFSASDSNYSRYGLYRADEARDIVRISDTVGVRYAVLNDSLYLLRDDYNGSIYTFHIEKTNSDYSALESVESIEGYKAASVTPVMIANTLFFAAQNNSLGQSNNLEVWAKVGTQPAYKLGNTYVLDDYAKTLVVVNDALFFVGNEIGIGDGKRLLKADENGTTLVHTFDSRINNLITLSGKLFFRYVNNSHFYLMSYDPQTQTLETVKDVITQSAESTLTSMQNLEVFADKILFETIDVGTNLNSYKYWVSDGTEAGTYPIFSTDYYGGTQILQKFTLENYTYLQDTQNNIYKTDFSSPAELVVESTCDVNPDSFELPSITDANLSTMYEHNITVSGINYPQTKISISGDGEYSLDNKTTWTTLAGTLDNNQTVYVRLRSSSSYSTEVSTELTIGTRDETFYVTTQSETLDTPNQFTFTDLNNTALSTVVEDSVTISGINIAVDLTISNGEYSLDNGVTWSNVATTVENNQQVYVRHTTSDSYETTVDTTLYVGGVQDTFSSTTRSAPVDNSGMVTVDTLMWEDTDHTRLVTLTWSEADTYCSDLTLGGYDDWRLPHSDINSGGTSEVTQIRVAGENDTDVTIIEGFTPVYHEDWITAWSDELVGTTYHVANIFQYGGGNADAFADSETLNVRCVRDIE
ncbi:hypothetical protein [Sulfurimonas sp.]|uniref:hypothetical protein n=1 Tax=Sulfurimonas sp. TaxID=2022749 RepID=UPI003D0AF8F7